MKRLITLALILILSVLTVSCGESRYEYDLTPYLTFHNFSPVKASFADPTVCTEKEIDAGLFQVMLTYAQYNEKSKDETVENFNRMTLNYCFYSQGMILEDTVTEDYTIVVGSEFNGEIDALLSQQALGKKVGDTLSLDYTYKTSEITLGITAGMQVRVEGEITKIERQTVPVCTDSFVQKMEGFDFQTVADLRESIRLDILRQKQDAKREAVREAFLEGVEVHSYPQEEWDRYYLEYLQEYRDSADEMGMELGEYLRDFLMIDEEKLQEFAREHADSTTKNDMIVLHLSRLLSVELSGKEYRTELEEIYEMASEQFESKKEMEKYYGKFHLENQFLWEKVLDVLTESAVSQEEA